MDLNDPRVQAKLMMAAGLLSPVRGKGWQGFTEAMGQGIQGGLLGFNQGARTQEAVKRGESERQMHEARLKQLQDAQKAQEYMGAGIGKFMSPGAPSVPFNDALGDGSQGTIPGQAPSFDQSGFAQYLAQNPATAREALNYMPKPKEPFKLGKSDRLIDPNTNKEIIGPSPEDWQNPEWVKTQQAIRAAGRPVVNATTNVMPPKEVFNQSLKLKNDFDGQPEVKGFKEVQHAWDQISTALKSPSPANDLAAATKYMKLLDPGSVVRESELALAMSATGLWDKITNYHNMLMNGEKLNPAQRKDFHSAGQGLFDAARGRYDQTVSQYEDIAKRYELDPSFLYKKQPGALVKNQTALMKARDAIKKGAQKDAVVKRLIEEGFDPEGI